MIYGEVWSTLTRPGRWGLRNVTTLPDPWADRFLGPAATRPTTRARLEALGLRWDGRRRTYLKPARRADGTVAYVDWNETRFAGPGVAGGYPGGPGDYEMRDQGTGERVTVINASADDVTFRKYPLLARVEVRPPPAAWA